MDDDLIIRDVKAVDEAIAALKEKGLVLKIKEKPQDHLSCEVRLSTNEKKA